jgi:osmotically-inducible protein OsmY
MKVGHLIGAVAVAGLAFAPPAALAQSAPTATTAAKADDGALKNSIETRIKNSPSLKGNDIDVDVANGVVTLTGKVHSTAQSTQAATLAKVTGVTAVENKLTVESKTAETVDKAQDKADAAAHKTGGAVQKSADKTADAADKAADKTADAAKQAGHETKSTAQKAGSKTEEELEKAGIKVENDKTGPKPNDGVHTTTGTTGQVAAKDKDAIDVDGNINDAWITTKVKTNFVNEDLLKGSDINVDSEKHVVTLKGTVPSAAARARAVELAKSTKGVTRVVDTLKIAPAK